MAASLKINTIETFLKDFHKKNPSCTPVAFAHGLTSEKLNSYDFLVSIMSEKDKHASVIDLACGDGTLSKKIIDRLGSDVNITGVDMSVGELDVARKNLEGYSVKFFEANAQNIPVQNSGADFIFCHMAFMLMDNIEQVVAEIHRCLKPEGIFSAVVGGKYEPNPNYDIFLNLLDKALKNENKKWLSDLGDPRTRSHDGLISLFDNQKFSNIAIKDFKIIFNERPVDLMNFFMKIYDVGLLSEDAQQQLYIDLLQSLNAIRNEDGRIEHFMWLRQTTCKRL